MVRQPAGQAAPALECLLVLMMAGQAADEAKQMVTYRRDYFNSPWRAWMGSEGGRVRVRGCLLTRFVGRNQTTSSDNSATKQH